MAVNLTGLATDEIDRGDVLVAGDGAVRPTYRVDAELEFDAEFEPDTGDRVQIHHGTREAPARLTWLGGRFWQIRLEQPLVPAAGDRLVVRRVAPPDTLGGGRVLDPAAAPARPESRAARPGSNAWLAAKKLRNRQDGKLDPAHPPPPPHGRRAKRGPKNPCQTPHAPWRSASVRPGPSRRWTQSSTPAILRRLREAGRAVRVSKTLHYHVDVLTDIRGRLVELAGRNGGAVTLAQLRDELGTSRKFAQALLEHFDSEKVTIRRGDEHVLRRRQ